MIGVRTDAMVNGALVVLGALAVVDNVVVHWILQWHRLIDGWAYKLYGEIALVVLGIAALTVGLVRERRAREPGGFPL